MIFLLLLLIIPYLLIPLYIKRNHYFSLQPNMRLLSNWFLKPFVKKNFESLTKDLKTLSFEPRIYALSQDYGPHMDVYMQLFVHKNDPIIAIATMVMIPGSKKPLKTFIEFISRFEGLDIVTHNSDLIGVPIERKEKRSAAYFSIKSLKNLFEIHKQRIKSMDLKSNDTLLLKEGEEFSWLKKTFQKDLQNQVDLGGLIIDTQNKCFRPTWAGAFLMGWYTMWPISLFRKAVSFYRCKMQLRYLKKAG